MEITGQVLRPDTQTAHTVSICSIGRPDLNFTLAKWGWRRGIAESSRLVYEMAVWNYGIVEVRDLTSVETLPREVMYHDSSWGCYPAKGNQVFVSWEGVPSGGFLSKWISVNYRPVSGVAPLLNSPVIRVRCLKGSRRTSVDRFPASYRWTRGDAVTPFVAYEIRYTFPDPSGPDRIRIASQLDDALDFKSLVVGRGGEFCRSTRTLRWDIRRPCVRNRAGRLFFGAALHPHAIEGSLLLNRTRVLP